MRKELKIPVILMSLFLTAYFLYFSFVGNYEFIVYILVTAIIVYAIVKLDEKYKFPVYSIWMFAVWVVLHMLGGSLIINDQGWRLYAWVIFDWVGSPYHILKYDQVVHAYCYFVFTILTYTVLKHHFKSEEKLPLYVLTILAAMGISLGNEIIEFINVIVAEAAFAVGDYYNTALDMVFNLLGSLVAIAVIHNKK